MYSLSVRSVNSKDVFVSSRLCFPLRPCVLSICIIPLLFSEVWAIFLCEFPIWLVIPSSFVFLVLFLFYSCFFGKWPGVEYFGELGICTIGLGFVTFFAFPFHILPQFPSSSLNTRDSLSLYMWVSLRMLTKSLLR